jgi:hypothetical protein
MDILASVGVVYLCRFRAELDWYHIIVSLSTNSWLRVLVLWSVPGVVLAAKSMVPNIWLGACVLSYMSTTPSRFFRLSSVRL